MTINNPLEIATVGQRIYDELYKADYEARFAHQFVAVDVDSKEAFVAAHPEQAIEKGRAKRATGIFHLIKIGSAGAFKVSYASNANSNWFF